MSSLVHRIRIKLLAKVIFAIAIFQVGSSAIVSNYSIVTVQAIGVIKF